MKDYRNFIINFIETYGEINAVDIVEYVLGGYDIKVRPLAVDTKNIEELTLKQVCKELGREVKIIK